tara:strand:- start:2464 stop:2979 length:516 start_codon:yes stop_codon:yes gene_type:complete
MNMSINVIGHYIINGVPIREDDIPFSELPEGEPNYWAVTDEELCYTLALKDSYEEALAFARTIQDYRDLVQKEASFHGWRVESVVCNDDCEYVGPAFVSVTLESESGHFVQIHSGMNRKMIPCYTETEHPWTGIVCGSEGAWTDEGKREEDFLVKSGEEGVPDFLVKSGEE